MSELDIGLNGSFLTLCAVSFFLNGTFVIVIFKSWKLVKERRITYHVTNLAISDCIVGASAFCSVISVTATGRMTTLGLAFYQILGMATLTSLLGVSLMAVERAVCVKKPHTWTQILPLKRILQIMTGNWVFIPGSLLHSYHRDFIRIRQYVYQNPEVNQCNWWDRAEFCRDDPRKTKQHNATESWFFRSYSRADIDNKCITPLYCTFGQNVMRSIKL